MQERDLEETGKIINFWTAEQQIRGASLSSELPEESVRLNMADTLVPNYGEAEDDGILAFCQRLVQAPKNLTFIETYRHEKRHASSNLLPTVERFNEGFALDPEDDEKEGEQQSHVLQLPWPQEPEQVPGYEPLNLYLLARNRFRQLLFPQKIECPPNFLKMRRVCIVAQRHSRKMLRILGGERELNIVNKVYRMADTFNQKYPVMEKRRQVTMIRRLTNRADCWIHKLPPPYRGYLGIYFYANLWNKVHHEAYLQEKKSDSQTA